ncbi:MAG: hypothetical protein ACRDCS_00015 [Tannerellaceae bacterium]
MMSNMQSSFSMRQKMINILYIVCIALLFMDESSETDLSESSPNREELSIAALSLDLPSEQIQPLNQIDSTLEAVMSVSGNEIARSKPFVRLEQPNTIVFTGIENVFNLHLSDIHPAELSFESDNATVAWCDSGVLITPLKTMKQFSIDIKRGKTLLDRYSFEARELPLPDLLYLFSSDSSITQCRMHDRILRSHLLGSKSLQFSNSLFPQVSYQLSEFSIVQRDALGNASKQVIRPSQSGYDFESIAHKLRNEKILLLTDIRLVVNNSYEQTLASFRLTLQ